MIHTYAPEGEWVSIENNTQRFNVLPYLTPDQRARWEEAELALRARCDDGCEGLPVYGPLMRRTDALRTILDLVPQADPRFLVAVNNSEAPERRRVKWHKGFFGKEFVRYSCPNCVTVQPGSYEEWEATPALPQRWGGILVLQKTRSDYGDPWMRIRVTLDSCQDCTWQHGDVSVGVHPPFRTGY